MSKRTAVLAAVATIGALAVHTLMTSTPAHADRATANLKMKEASTGKRAKLDTPSRGVKAQARNRSHGSHRTHQPITIIVR